MISPRTLLTTGQLALLCLVAFLSASTVNAWIAGLFRSHPSLSPNSPGAEAAPERKRPISYYAPITAKDIFNPARAAELNAEPQAAPVNAKLLGTAPGSGVESFAIIEDAGNKTQQLYRVGDKFQSRTLSGVEWDHVVLKGGHGDEILKIVEPNSKAGPPAAAAGEGSSSVLQRSDNEFVIDRSEVDKAMENMNQLFTQIRAVPHFQDGKAAGFRLFAIKQGSVFDKIGLKNGDIITGINGNDLTDPARAMGLIQELRNQSHVTVDVNRNRQVSTLNYEIR
jgi:general secretion pathway protein C